jgi:hypothetical protein
METGAEAAMTSGGGGTVEGAGAVLWGDWVASGDAEDVFRGDGGAAFVSVGVGEFAVASSGVAGADAAGAPVTRSGTTTVWAGVLFAHPVRSSKATAAEAA